MGIAELLPTVFGRNLASPAKAGVHGSFATAPRNRGQKLWTPAFAGEAVRVAAVIFAVFVVSLPALAAGPKGPLVIAGGEFSFANPGWKRFAELAGGAGAPVLIIPTASGTPEATGKRHVEHLASLGLRAEVVPLWAKDGKADATGAATDPAWVAKARAAKGIWFVGGDQARITDALLKPDDSPTPLLAAIREAHAAGAVVGGSSAGAAIMSARMFKEGPEPLDALSKGLEAGRETDTGLGFIGDGWFVDQHFLARGRIGRMVVALRDLGYRRGVGVEEDTAIVVTAGRTAEVVGRAVLLVDMATAKVGAGVPFRAEGVTVALASGGDRFDLETGAVTPAEVRAKGPIDPAKPYLDSTKPFWTADMLGPGVLSDLMGKVADSRSGLARGIAFAEPGEGPTQPGFEFTLTRTPESRGWYASGGGATGYTVTGLRLDIRPVAMARPLYTPLAP